MRNTESTSLQEGVEGEVDRLLAAMTLKEKVYMLNGNMPVLTHIFKYKNAYNPVPIVTNGCRRLGIPPLAFSDGPRGIVMGRSTCFPVSMARGATFDRTLEHRVGEAIAREAWAQGANLFGGVCINLLCFPNWGRSQETYGEDTYHVGEMGVALVDGVQTHGVIACVKHFALNNVENTRFKVNVGIGDRALHEVFLPHFKKAIDAGAMAVMGAYNKVRGEFSCESAFLLTHILRERWGFRGITISDFIFGIRDTEKAIMTGMDVEMPAPVHYHRKLLSKLRAGKISEETLDTSVKRVLHTVLTLEQNAGSDTYGAEVVGCEEHRMLAREVAENSIVLLKNENNLLPLRKPRLKLLLVGDMAGRSNLGDHGSSRVRPSYTVTPLEAIKQLFEGQVAVVHKSDAELESAALEAPDADAVLVFVGCGAKDEGEFLVPDKEVNYGLLADGYKNNGEPLKSLVARALLKLAPLAMGASQEDGKGIGGDRPTLSLRPSHREIVERMASCSRNVIVVLVGGGPIITRPWESKVASIIHYFYAGMEGGTALARIIGGEVSPSGKLPFSIPRDESCLPTPGDFELNLEYQLYHGYSLLESEGIEAGYCFGHGLSYTTFMLKDALLRLQGRDICLSVAVENTGTYTGKEVVQVYIEFPNAQIRRRSRLLKAFEKIELDPNEETCVDIEIKEDELRYYCETTQAFAFEQGTYKVFIGTSKRNSEGLVLSANLS